MSPAVRGLAALFALFALFALAAPAAGAPITLVRDGVVAAASGPETVGGVAAGDTFRVTVALDPAGITGTGAETATPLALGLAIGTALFDQDDHDPGAGAIAVLLQDGRLVGVTFRTRFTAASGAAYWLTLAGDLLEQTPIDVPPGVVPSRVRGRLVTAEPRTSALIALVAGALFLCRPR